MSLSTVFINKDNNSKCFILRYIELLVFQFINAMTGSLYKAYQNKCVHDKMPYYVVATLTPDIPYQISYQCNVLNQFP